MDYLVIEGVLPWDGRYEFDLEQQPFTTREWGWIKRHSGYMPLTVEQGFQGGDPELFAALAVISLFRAGRITPADVADVFERFADAPYGGTIRLETDEAEQEGDAGPPAGSANGSSSSSGDGSPTSSEMWAPPQEPGIPASDTSASRRVGSPT